MSLFNISGLCFKYGNYSLFDHLQLDMQEGEIIALLGPNGCGKTTLLDCIIGYKLYESGTVQVKGMDVKKYSIKEMARHIAYVPQSAHSIFPYSVMQMVLMGRTPHLGGASSPNKNDTEIALEAMDTLGLFAFKDRAFSSLSGGERQLVLIARALAQDSQIILLDEPTSSLDIKNEIMVLSNIKKLVNSRSKSLIIATHQPNHVFFLEKEDIPVRAALFAERKIKYFGRPSEVMNEQTIREVYNVHCELYEYKDNHKTIIVNG